MKNVICFLLFSLFLISCSKDSEVIGIEISGTSSLNGTYMLDKSYTKGPKYVNTEDTAKRLITYDDKETNMWGLMNRNYLVYKIEKNGEIPPESGWECGVGVDKDKFKCILIYDD